MPPLCIFQSWCKYYCHIVAFSQKMSNIRSFEFVCLRLKLTCSCSKCRSEILTPFHPCYILTKHVDSYRSKSAYKSFNSVCNSGFFFVDRSSFSKKVLNITFDHAGNYILSHKNSSPYFLCR